MTMLDGDVNPHFFHWPSLIFYLFAALFTTASWVQRALGADPGLTSAEQVLLARGCVAAAGTATVVVLYWLGRRIGGRTTGLAAAVFLAVAVLHVRDSHFAMTDIVMTLLLTISLALIVRAFDAAGADSWRLFAAAGFAGGLAASTKYSAAAVLVAMAAAQVLLWTSRRTAARSAPSAAFLIAFAAGFLVATPFAVLDFPTFYADLRFDFTHLADGHEGIDLGPGWIYHLTHSLPHGVGVPIFLAALIGIVPFIRHYRRHAIILGAFVAAFYAAFGSGYTVFFRYILPLVPMVCLLAAVAVRHASPWFSVRTGLSLRTSTILLVTVLAGPSLLNSLWLDVLLARTDTRVLAAQWLDANVGTGESMQDAGGQYTRLRLKQPMAANAGGTADWLVLHDSPLRAYTVTAPGLRALAAEQYDLAHTVDAGRGSVYDLQDAFFLPIAGFSGVERPGPTIRIYRRKKQSG
jgi:4-amino-4-deoxy-L-arabinose transferase-like glycosyltransferase